MKLYTWKVFGLRGLTVCMVHINAINAQFAKRSAKKEMGYWLILGASRV